MVMMDDEKNKRLFNEARAECKIRYTDGFFSYCGILTRKKSACFEDNYNNCPLWTFVKKINRTEII